MPMLVLLLALACLAAAVFLVGEVATQPARQRRASVRRAAGYGRMRFLNVGPGDSFRERALLPAKARLARAALRVNPKTTLESVSLKLLAAGVGRTVTPVGFLSGKAALAAAGIVLGGMVGGVSSGFGAGLLFAIGFAASGFLFPDLLVALRTRSRSERVRAQLPDALDILAVSVEAGLGFDGAIAKLIEHMHGPLTEEFELVLGEMRIGESRADALKKMAERVETPEISAFVRAIVQADQLGTSLGRILRVQAADTRLRRQAAAEERAMKAPIKMLFPTVLFIFPAMFLVILGPAFLNLSKIF